MLTSPVEIKWITATRLIRANRRIVAATGEPFGVRDPGLLESAAASVLQLNHYEAENDLIRLAVRLIRSVGKNHPFDQGNKRTAFNGAVAFLIANQVEISLPDTEAVAELVVRLITGEVEEQKLVDYLQPFCCMKRN